MKINIIAVLIIFISVITSGFATTVLAATPEQQPAVEIKNPSSSGSPPTLGEMLAQGGPLMPVLYSLSFIALCLIFYYFLSLRIELIAPSSLSAQADDAIKKKDFDLLRQLCLKDGSPMSKIIVYATDTLKKPDCSYNMFRDAIEDEGARQGNMLWQRIQYLQDVAVVSPMVGLLGTCFGMIKSFGALNAENMTPRPTTIASGVAMALITTAAGLIIGITAMFMHSYFRGRVNSIISELEEKSGRLLREMTSSIGKNI